MKISQGSAVTQTLLDGLPMRAVVANFLAFRIHKLLKLVGSGHSYCDNKGTYFFGPPLIHHNQLTMVQTNNINNREQHNYKNTKVPILLV